jgi:GH24 family phage-related lysozyme (muramidase)
MLPVILGVARIGAVALRGVATGIAATARVAVKGTVAAAKAIGRGVASATRGAGKAIKAIGKAAKKGVASVARGVGKIGTRSGDSDKSNEYEETENSSESDATPQSANNINNEDSSDENKNNIQESKETSLVGSATILQAISNQISILRKTVEGYESLLFKKEQSSEAADIEKEVIEDATKEGAKPKKEDKKSEGLIQKLLGGLLLGIFAFLPNIMKFFRDSKEAIKALPQKIIDSFKGIIDSISGVIKEYVVDPIVKFFKVDVGAALDTLFIFIGDKIEAIMDFPKRLMNAALMKLNELMTDAITTFLPIIKRFLPDDYVKTIETKLGTLKAEKKKLEGEKTALNKRQVAREKTTISDTFDKAQAERQAQYDKERPPTGATGGTGQVAQPEIGGKVTPISGMDDIKKMIKGYEGKGIPGKPGQPYQDSKKLWTVGYGHLIGNGTTGPGPYAGRTLSEEEMDALFEVDFAKHVKMAEKAPGWNMANESGKAAMIDLTYNMGPGWYIKFKAAARALKEGDFARAAAELLYKDASDPSKGPSGYSRDVGKRAQKTAGLLAAGKGTGDQLGGTAVAEAPAGVGEQIGAKPKPETAASPQVAVVVPPASPTGGNAGGKKLVSKPDPNQVQQMYAQGLGMPGTA